MKMRINYNQVLRQAQQIDDIIQQLNVRKIELQNLERNLPAAWDGEAAQTFRSKVNELNAELYSAIKEMSAIKNTILTVARNIKQEDERLARLLASRQE